MKKALIVKLAMALVVAVSASSWAQEVQPSLSDNVASPAMVQDAAIVQQLPIMQAPMAMADCGCNQTYTAAPMQQYAQPATGCASCNSGCSSCSSCGTVGQVGYNQPIQTGSPVVNSAPIGAYGQAPMYSNVSSGCCGQTYAPTYSNASVTTAAPMVYTGDSGCSSCEPAPCNTCNTCDPCQQKRRGLFNGRFRR